ncbi:CamS family sex pheromone protein [Evansella sp. LMS18]|jgi:protein involved in sex pheromone biosynthesis|uniref:CamS family sex pheromone protein n=1 Tax=Evansella sp. LMS18 TaxID=2924033 RepID=UPI0020D17473|nr:CamS family sex pheromone protein [Evansella sp. LMS18]UTR08832.1 CamS family sex pheromone protein [Evansella sp. LMS18]
MNKKISLLMMSFVLILTGCIPTLDRGEDEVIIVEESEAAEEEEYVLTPTINTPENHYRNVLRGGTYNRSEARGSTAHTMERIDINQFELGLMEIASTAFDREQYYFQEGEFISGSQMNRWLRRYNPDEEGFEEGLNPPLAEGDSDEERMRQNPIILSHIMEHNYMYVTDDEEVRLGGIVLGLSLNSVYYFQTRTEDGGIYQHEEPIDADEAEARGREIAQELLSRIRQDERLSEVPVTIALYQENSRGAIVPGSFISLTNVGENQSEIQSWEAINEQFYFFPSREAREVFPSQAAAFSQFKDEVEEFFDRSLGIVGKGRYKNEALEEMTIEFNLQSHGKAEIIALTQFISSRIPNLFPDEAPIYVYVNSVNGPESLIVQYPGHEPYVHVYK